MLVTKWDDSENRMCRNNGCVLDLPEGTEGDRPVELAEAFFKDLLGLIEIFPSYVVEHAHRVPTSPDLSWSTSLITGTGFLVKLGSISICPMKAQR